MRLYPNESPFVSYKIEEYVTRCMEMHRYKYDASPHACVAPSKDDGLCYVPTSWIGRLMYSLRNWMDGLEMGL